MAEEKFRGSLDKLAERMLRETRREVLRLYRHDNAPTLDHVAMDASFTAAATKLFRELSKRFNALFTDRAGGLAEALAKGVSNVTAAQLGSSLKEVSGGVTLKTDVVSGEVGEVIKAGIRENVALIKSIPDKYFLEIQGAVMRSVQTGQGISDLEKQLSHYEGVTKRRAALIARDQTSKATTAINRARMKGLGIKKFEWLHSYGGKEPRQLHKNVLNGQIFDLDNPPVIDDRTGERGLPGQLINCRCRMIPVISFEAEETTGQ